MNPLLNLSLLNLYSSLVYSGSGYVVAGADPDDDRLTAGGFGDADWRAYSLLV